jgi:hypothetical protein
MRYVVGVEDGEEKCAGPAGAEYEEVNVMWGGSVCECHCDGELRQAKDREIEETWAVT